MTGGGGANVLVGAAGNDVLLGVKGRNLLIGCKGMDRKVTPGTFRSIRARHKPLSDIARAH